MARACLHLLFIIGAVCSFGVPAYALDEENNVLQVSPQELLTADCLCEPNQSVNVRSTPEGVLSIQDVYSEPYSIEEDYIVATYFTTLFYGRAKLEFYDTETNEVLKTVEVSIEPKDMEKTVYVGDAIQETFSHFDSTSYNYDGGDELTIRLMSTDPIDYAIGNGETYVTEYQESYFLKWNKAGDYTIQFPQYAITYHVKNRPDEDDNPGTDDTGDFETIEENKNEYVYGMHDVSCFCPAEHSMSVQCEPDDKLHILDEYATPYTIEEDDFRVYYCVDEPGNYVIELIDNTTNQTLKRVHLNIKKTTSEINACVNKPVYTLFYRNELLYEVDELTMRLMSRFQDEYETRLGDEEGNVYYTEDAYQYALKWNKVGDYTIETSTDTYIYHVREHFFEDTKNRTEPTCTDEGAVEKRCSVCGKTYVESIPAKGHRLFYVQGAISETYDVQSYYLCEDCGRLFTDETCAFAADESVDVMLFEKSDYELPENLLSISYMAMSNIPAESIICNEGLQEIGEKAFLDCPNLRRIYIPPSVTFIGWKAFDGCKDLTIWGTSGSYAQEYAEQEGLLFIPCISSQLPWEAVIPQLNG